MEEIELYDFVDCLLLGFNVNATLSILHVIVEAYYPFLNDKPRIKGLIKIICSQISQLHLEKNNEFDFDLQLSYNQNGNDVKANELYAVQCIDQGSNIIKVVLNADFLNFELTCSLVEVVEIDKL